MSADRYSPCPKCLKEDSKRREEIAAQYGKIDKEEWTRLNREQSEREMEGDTLREDWDIWITNGNIFNVSYQAKCVICGFKYSFTDKRNMEGELK